MNGIYERSENDEPQSTDNYWRTVNISYFDILI